jgi:hypothetical protein
MQNPGSHIYFFLSQLGEIQAKRTKEVKEQ